VTRLHALAAHPRRTLAALAVVLAAVGITVGSGANFTASAANPGNAFSTGTLVITDSSSTALLNASNMKPGGTPLTSTVDISNTGTLAGDFVLKTANPTGYAALLGQIDLTVADCGVWSGGTAPSCASPTTKYSGKANALTTATLGNFAGGDKHRYLFTAQLNSSADDTYQGKTAGIDFAWSATQS
jgi:hypothetical protein